MTGASTKAHARANLLGSLSRRGMRLDVLVAHGDGKEALALFKWCEEALEREDFIELEEVGMRLEEESWRGSLELRKLIHGIKPDVDAFLIELSRSAPFADRRLAAAAVLVHQRLKGEELELDIKPLRDARNGAALRNNPLPYLWSRLRRDHPLGEDVTGEIVRLGQFLEEVETLHLDSLPATTSIPFTGNVKEWVAAVHEEAVRKCVRKAVDELDARASALLRSLSSFEKKALIDPAEGDAPRAWHSRVLNNLPEKVLSGPNCRVYLGDALVIEALESTLHSVWPQNPTRIETLSLEHAEAVAALYDPRGSVYSDMDAVLEAARSL